MAYLSGLGVDRISGGKIFLKGWVKGAESGYKYCLYYGEADLNLPNGNQHYTFFSGPGDLNLKNQGCYIPTDISGSYRVTCKMVGANCEDVFVEEDSVYVSTPAEPDPEPEPETEHWLTIIARRADGSPLLNVAVMIDGIVKGYTGHDGSKQILLPEKQYEVKGVPPIGSGLECDDGRSTCVDIVMLNTDALVNFTFVKPEEPEPEEWCFFDVYVKDSKTGSPVDANVYVPGADGPDNMRTGADGYVPVTVKCGKSYNITVSKDGYTQKTVSQSVNSGTKRVDISLVMKVGTCPDVEAKFTAHAEWYNDAQTEILVGEEISIKDSSSSDRKIVQSSVDWGDGHADVLDHVWWDMFGMGDKVAEHNYANPGPYKIRYTVENECGSTDFQDFHITVLSEEQIECSISAPATAIAGETFAANVRCNPGQTFYVKIGNPLDALYAQTVGKGTCGADGLAEISCKIDNPGEFVIFGYDSGSSWFPGGYATNDIPITISGDSNGNGAEPEFSLDVPKVAMAGEIEFSGHAPAGATVLIKAESVWFGFDRLAKDQEIARVVADADGNYSGTFELDEFGSVTVYGQVKKGGIFDWLVADLYTAKHTVFVVTTIVLAASLIAALLVVEKKFSVVGLFRKR